MDTATIALIFAAIAFGAVIAVIFAPARNAALGAWSLASWSGKRRRPRDATPSPQTRS